MKTKRILAVVLCLLMAISICGCNNTEKTQSETGERSLTHKITDEPLELTYFAKNIESAKDESIFTKAYDMTNVLIKPTLSENVTDMDQALALAVAAKDIPDIIYDWKPENFNKYGSQGALIPLNDLIEEHAPNYKKFLEEHPDIKYLSTAADGNIYFIPFIMDGEASTGWFIRQDWLDKLNLKAPETVEEMYDVMVAFRDKDPNGNGKKDEVPYFGMQGDIASLLSLFNAYEGFHYENGKVTFGPMEEGFLAAIKEVGKWYQEGLIDEEYFTRSDAQDFLTSNNTGGITHEWFGSTAKTNDKLKDAIPGYNLVPFAPPAGADGVRRELNRRGNSSGEGWAISSMNEYPVETIKYFDFWFSEEGRRLANFGIEGIHNDMVDGKPVLKDSVINDPDGVGLRMIKTRAMTNFGYWQDFSYESQWTNQIARDGIAMYNEGGYLPKIEERPKLSYFEDEKQHNVLKTQIETYLDEMLQHWVFGTKDPDATYNEAIKNLKSLGIEEYIQIEQKAYDKYMQFMGQ